MRERTGVLACEGDGGRLRKSPRDRTTRRVAQGVGGARFLKGGLHDGGRNGGHAHVNAAEGVGRINAGGPK